MKHFAYLRRPEAILKGVLPDKVVTELQLHDDELEDWARTIVLDTTAGTGVSLVGRQGGSGSDWTVGGTTNYESPDAVAMQTGATGDISTTAGAATTLTVTFPRTYTEPPLVLVAVADKTGTDMQVAQVVSATETGFVVSVFNFDSGSGTARVFWQAIGAISESLSLLQEMMADSPFALYPMQEGSGTLMTDVAGNGLDGTYSGVTFGGGFGSIDAANFDGVNDYAQTPSLDLTGTSVVTVACQFYWTGYANDDDIAIELGVNVGTARGFYFDPNMNAGDLSIAMSTDAAAVIWSQRYPRTPIPAGSWHMVHIVYDYSAGGSAQGLFYVDGVLQSPGGTQGPTNANDVTGNHANAVLTLMSRNGASSFGGGRMAYLGVYDHALSAPRIAAHANAAARA